MIRHSIEMPSSYDDFAIDDVLTRLRKATAMRHDKLDLSMPLSKANPTLWDYYHHLWLLRVWLNPIEKWQECFSDGPQGVDAPVKINRTKLIDADLKNIPHGFEQTLFSSCLLLWPSDAKTAYRWGVSYVVEGAQLGGIVLYKRLATFLAGQSCLYLRGEEGGSRWKHFLLIMGKSLKTEAEIVEACRGACDAFDKLLSLQNSKESHQMSIRKSL